jgi:lactate dehydrogenase-like 2-hydroxyacid dehydrogenase
VGETQAKSLDVLMPAAGLGMLGDLIAERLPLHRLWLEADRDARLAEWRPRIRAVAASGPQARIDAAFMSGLPNLEIVASFGVGYDHVDAKWAREHGVIVTHTPGVLDDEVADTAMALTLMAVRRLPQAERYLRAGGWLKANFPLTASLRDRTMGILGLGRIGKAIAKRAESFGLGIVYHGRRPQADVAYLFYPSLVEMAKACDILMVAAPGGPETRHIVNAEVLRALGPDSVLVNIARGSLVDETALIEALRAGALRAAGLDVFEDEPRVPPELIALDNAVLLPHVGSASVKTRRAMAECVVANLVAWSEGKPPLTPVPETPWRGQWGDRLQAPASKPGRGDVSNRTTQIAGILGVMRTYWDLPADCNEGELFAYAEMLLDRIQAGDGKEALYPFLAGVQVENLEMPKSDAFREIVDRSVDLVKNSG